MGNTHASPLVFKNVETGIWTREENPTVVCIISGLLVALYLLYVVIAIIKVNDADQELDNANEYLYLVIAPAVLPLLAIVLLVFMTAKRFVKFDDTTQTVTSKSASMVCLGMKEDTASYTSITGCEYERVDDLCVFRFASSRKTYELRIKTGPQESDSITLARVHAYTDVEAQHYTKQLSHFVMCRTSGGGLCHDPLADSQGPQAVPFANFLHQSTASNPGFAPPPLAAPQQA